MNKLLLLPILLASIVGATAQNATVKLLVKPDATEIKFVYRLSEEGATAEVDLGGGERATLSQPEPDKLQSFTHRFAQPSSELRTIELATEQLVTLRITSSKTICGVKELHAPLLERFNCDYTPLQESEALDFSHCPKLEEITLNGAEVARVVLPPNRSLLKTFQWATPLLPLPTSKQLESLDLSGCSALENLSLQGTSLHTIDLADSPHLKELAITGLNNKKYPRRLIGGKALKELKLVTIQYCAFTYDMLPDLNDTPLDNFKVSKMYYAYVDRSHYRGMQVDLSHLASAKGLATTTQPTTFTWYYKNSAGKWTEIPAEQVKASKKQGVFDFAESLLDPNTKQVTVRAKLFNAGYPDLAFYKSGLHTFNITLPYHPTTMSLTLTSESPGKDEDGYDIEELDVSMQVAAEKANTKIAVDWGDGQRKEYTIPKAREAFSLSQTVDLGAKIKIYGPVSLVDATGSKVVSVAFEDAATIKTLRLSRNLLESIDLSRLPNLTELQVTDNKLAALDLTPTPKLSELYCGYNQLTTLPIEYTPELSVLNCNDNQLTALALAKLPKLEIAVVSGNAFGDALDFSENKRLRILDIEHCKLTKVNLASEYLERVKANDNKLSTLELIPYTGLALNLYSLDIRDNLFSACDLNDLLIQLPPAGDTSERRYAVLLAGNPGATTYDSELVNRWQVDNTGDGKGCKTAKIFDASTTENGSAYIRTGTGEIAFGTPMQRGSSGSIVLTPNEGYMPDFCKWGTSKLTPEDEKGLVYFFVLKGNTFVTYSFKKATGKEEVGNRSNRWVITPTATGWEIETPYSEKRYELYDLAGKLSASGTTDAEGKLRCLLPEGAYILSIAGASVKIIR